MTMNDASILSILRFSFYYKDTIRSVLADLLNDERQLYQM